MEIRPSFYHNFFPRFCVLTTHLHAINPVNPNEDVGFGEMVVIVAIVEMACNL